MRHNLKEATDGLTLVGYQPVRQLIGTQEYVRVLFKSSTSGEEAVLFSDQVLSPELELEPQHLVLTKYPWVDFRPLRHGERELQNAVLNRPVEGVTLAEFVNQQGPMNQAQLLTLTVALLDAEAAHPELLDRLTPDSLVIGFNGEPRFTVGPIGGVGVQGCLWFAVTGTKPLVPYWEISQLRQGLPRSVLNVLEQFFTGAKVLADVMRVLSRLTEPLPLFLGVKQQERKIRWIKRVQGVLANILIGCFTLTSLAGLGWQIRQTIDDQRTRADTEANAQMRTSTTACLWQRLAHQRTQALSGVEEVMHDYLLPDSSAAVAEQRLLELLSEQRIQPIGLVVSMHPVGEEQTRCDDPVGLFNWLPVMNSESEMQEQVEMLVGGHWQLDRSGKRVWKAPLKQILDVKLRLDHGSWLLEEVVVVKSHVQ